MIRPGVFIMLLLGTLVFGDTVSMAQNSPGVQALEAQLKEAERNGITGPEIDMLRDMLEALKREEAEAGSVSGAVPGSGSDSGPTSGNSGTAQMRPNHFDAMGKASYGDCSRYDDKQAFAFCVNATDAFQSYVDAFQKGAQPVQLRIYYDAHVMSAENLVTYIDGGTAPNTTTRQATGDQAGQSSQSSQSSQTAPQSGNAQSTGTRSSSDSGTSGTATRTSRQSTAGTNKSSGQSVGTAGTAGKSNGAGKVYELMPETSIGEMDSWFSKRDSAIFHSRLRAIHEISSTCRDKGARVDRPRSDSVRAGDAPPHWTFSAPECKQGGWEDKEWSCRTRVAGHCYRRQ